MKYFLAIILIFCFSCGTKQTEKPEEDTKPQSKRMFVIDRNCSWGTCIEIYSIDGDFYLVNTHGGIIKK